MIIVVHGGAGTIKGIQRRKLAAEGVKNAVINGFQILKRHGSATHAVLEAVKIMEDLPQFNAGFGSVITEEETIEMDALIVDGFTGNMGGVMSVSRVKNPIVLAKLIMDKSRHLFFSGIGAEKFATKNGMQLIDPSELITQNVKERFSRFTKSKEMDGIDPEGREKFGTVGAVALDQIGNLAAATSTGGILGKEVGRVGDTSMFGCGTYADKKVAISATGVGEYIIQGLLAIRIQNLMEANNLEKATEIGLNQVYKQFGPAGVIALNSNGQWSAQKTTSDLIYAMKSKNEKLTFLDFQ